MKYRFIWEERNNFPIATMCRILKVTRQGYYASIRRGKSAHAKEDEALGKEILAIYKESRELYGSPRIYAALKAKGLRTSKKRVARIMAEMDIQGVMKRKKPKPRKEMPENASAADHLSRQFAATEPNMVWVGDITYIKTGEGWLYLAVEIDLFSRMIVGWKTSTRMTSDFVEDALLSAIQKRKPKPGLIHHSDHGAQYRSNALAAIMDEYGIISSMGAIQSPWDNAPAESVMSTIKSECVKAHAYTTNKEAELAIFDYIETFYNRKRIHSALGNVSPLEYEEIHASKKGA